MMFSRLFDFLFQIDAVFWGYIGFSLIIFLGSLLTIRTRFFQIRALPYMVQTFVTQFFRKKSEVRGLHPLRTFFASVGGMLGVGNIVGIVTAIQLGGPGALLWVWVAGFGGSLIKYSEVYLGLRYRVQNERHGYDGGPMFFLQRAFRSKWIPAFVSLLLCIYGAEIYQFNVVVDTIATSIGMERAFAVIALLGLVLYAAIGGTSRVSTVCVWFMPVFLFGYIGMSLYVVAHYYANFPALLREVVSSAFTGHAAIGGAAGGSMLLAVQNGMASACYAADIGIGFDSTIQSESCEVHPERQASIALVGVCLDNFICTLSILVVLVTGLWRVPVGEVTVPLVQQAFAHHFYFVDVVMPFFIFVLGYTTLISYLSVGMKCARYLSPKYGIRLYMCYSTIIIVFFSFSDQTIALMVMRIAGALLLITNLLGVFRLRNEIVFDYSWDSERSATLKSAAV